MRGCRIVFHENLWRAYIYIYIKIFTHTLILYYTYGTKRGKQHQTQGKHKRELNHQTKGAVTKCKKGKKNIKQKNRTQNKLDLKILELNHQATVNIYIL